MLIFQSNKKIGNLLLISLKQIESYLNKSISGLLVIFLGEDSQLSKKTNSVSKGTHKPSISEQT